MWRPRASLSMHCFLGNRAKKEEYRRTMYWTSCKPTRQECLMWWAQLWAILSEGLPSLTHLSWFQVLQYHICNRNLTKGLNSRSVKHSPTGNCPENHNTGLTLHFQMKQLPVRQYRCCQTKLSLLIFFFLQINVKKKKRFALIMPNHFGLANFQTTSKCYLFTCIHRNYNVTHRKWISGFQVSLNRDLVSDVPFLLRYDTDKLRQEWSVTVIKSTPPH